MIKRRFYKLEHGDRDAPSESSSSSDSEVEAEATDETEEEEDEEGEDTVARVREIDGASSSSGYESEDSSANEVNLDSSGLPTSDEDVATQNNRQCLPESHPIKEGSAEPVNNEDRTELKRDETPFDVADCVLKCKSVFKCRLCPRIVCLSEETLKAHLNSKRHARSVKLLKEGRLKLMLNEDGKIEGEIHPEKHDDTPVVSQQQNSTKSKKKDKGRQRQKKRFRKSDQVGKAKQSTNKSGRKKRKHDN